MTQTSYFITNGSSLEDCHTNFFALADLCGIKWRPYSCDKNFNDPNDDPILNSFAKCINANLLCVWRRIRINNTQEQNARDLYVNYSKELWIFWYGDEPDLKDLVSPSLKEGDQGSWESGLSYECRTLLFKALHNLIERCLLSKGYSRMGRWFFQVKNREISSDILKEGTQITFKFDFFLHGDSNVCTNVDVQQHSAVRPITKEDIHAAQQIPEGIRVLLSPFGLQGYLTGIVFKENDQNVQKFLQDWNKIYPLPSVPKNVKTEKSATTFPNTFANATGSSTTSSSNDDITFGSDFSTKVVEVIVGNSRAKYPAAFVFITETDSNFIKAKLNYQNDKVSKNLLETFQQLSKQSSENLENMKLIMSPYYNRQPEDTYYLKNNFNQVINFCDQLDKIDRNGLKNDSTNHINKQSGEMLWKKNCSCSICQNPNSKKHSKTSNSVSSSNSFSMKSKSSDKDRSGLRNHSVPFHHRMPMNLSHELNSLQNVFNSSSQSNNNSNNNVNLNNNNSNNNMDSSSPMNVSMNNSNNNNQSNITPMMMPYKSPVSTSTSSILNTPGIESSPMSNFNLETNEHISPLPSVTKDEIGSINTPTNNQHQQQQPPQIGCSPKTNDNKLSTIESTNNNCDPRNSATTTTTNNSDPSNNTSSDQQVSQAIIQHNHQNHLKLDKRHFKRCYRYKSIYDDECSYKLRTGLLYDFSCETNCWEETQPKNRRFKQSHSTTAMDDLVADLQNSSDSRDPYEFSDYDDPDLCGSIKSNNHDSLLDSNLPINGSEFPMANGCVPEYMYNNGPHNNKSSDNDNNNNINKNGTNPINNYNGNNNHSTFIAKNGECDSIEFLSSPADDDNNHPLNKNPNSVGMTTNDTESMISSLNNTSVLGPTELSRMFPTPPSLEAMVSSPCSTYVATETAKPEKTSSTNNNNNEQSTNGELVDVHKNHVHTKNETDATNSGHHCMMNDINDQKEIPLVYMPPVLSLFVTSNKYAPLENVECKNTLPASFHYKHNNNSSRINQQSMKNLCISQHQSHHHHHHLGHPHHHQQHPPFNPHHPSQLSMQLNKNKPNHGTNMPPTNNKMMNPSFANNAMMHRPGPNNRPTLNHPQNPMAMAMNPHMHPRMARNPSLPPPPPQQQQYPSGNMMDNFSPSPMSALDNHRRSPFIFPQQQPTLNSPSSSNSGLVIGNQTPMNNGLAPPPPKNMAAMMGPQMYQQQMNPMDPTNAMMIPTNECHSLMLNLLLSDSMFNLFRDHNFESCCICVCNMNIKGNDVGIYLPEQQSQQQQNYDYYSTCTCGFSAITNRHLSHFAGLFYEDEVEVTGIYYDPIELSLANKENQSNNCSNGNNNDLQLECFVDKDFKKMVTEIDENFLDLITNQSTTIFPSASTLAMLMNTDPKSNQSRFKTFNLKDKSVRRDPMKLMYDDYTSVIQMSLQMTRCDPNKQNMLMPIYNANAPPLNHSNRPVLHDWQFRKSNYPVNNHEAMLTLKTLQPLMQESVQRKGPMNEVTYNTVKGPLTWRQFHRLAGRGTECQCEPQPIPSLLVGCDKECVAMSPFGLKFWEKLSLEPYAIHRDVQYIVITPNDEHNIMPIKNFFKELSTTYEILRLGRHTPLNKVASDGIYVLGNNNNNNNSKFDFAMDDWFNQLGDSNLANKIRSYAQALYDLLPSLTNTDRGHLESKLANNGMENNSNGPSNPNNICNNNNSMMNNMNGNVNNSYGSSTGPGVTNSMLSSSASYNNSSNNNSVNAKTMNNFNNTQNNANNSSDNNQLLNDLDSSHNTPSSEHNNSGHGNASFQPFDEEEDPHKYPSIMIYVLESFSPFGKEVTRFGSIGLLKTFSIVKKFFPEHLKNNIHMQMLSLNSVISNDKDFRDYPRQPQLKELSFAIYSQCKQQLVMQPNIKSLTGLGPAASFETFLKNKNPFHNRLQLYTSPFILAPMKDKQTELGEMFGDRREKSQILFCIYCLTEDKKWILASCTNDKGDILQSKIININIPNRTRRRKASSQRFGLDKLMTFIQTIMSESVIPWRLIISRLGRIGHGELKEWTSLLSKKSLMKYSRKLREMCEQCRYLGSNEQPAIYSACLTSFEADTTLRVFPNYYTPDERFSSSCNTCSLSTPEDASCSHILVFPTSATTQSTHANFNLPEELFSGLEESDIPVDEEIEFFNDFFNELSPKNNGPQPDSPGTRQMFGNSNPLKNSSLLEDQDESAQLLQQPLALAFYLSTAKAGNLPRWFWAHCPNLENTCPVFLKSALLIHTPYVQQNTDDILQSNNRDCHPLDSNLTTDVLRCCLEGYNSLSWLVLDPVTNDRQSCLPFHIQTLMQLYHVVETLLER